MKILFPARTAAAALALIFLLPAFSAAQDELRPAAAPNAWLGILGGRFAPSDSVFKEVYGTEGLALGLSAGRMLYRSEGFSLAVDLDVRRFAKPGGSTISGTASRLTLIPIAAGLEAAVRRGTVGLWLGGGADWIFYSEDSEWILSRGSAFGFHVAGGLFLEPASGPILKAYIRWSKASKAMEGFTVDLGGTEIGAALLFRFDL
ncbi:MAG: hypothetical protein NTZ26_11530 [Candidatus Aminicenantes bacterium]|nr:hypothetical protein [Candidatus Aminicenantes bacterium]